MKKILSLLLVSAMLFGTALSISAKDTNFTGKPFDDVPETHWAYASVMKLRELGLIHGQTEKIYNPSACVNSFEVAQVYLNIDGGRMVPGLSYGESKTVGFDGLTVPEARWYAPAVKFVSYNGIMPVECNEEYCVLYGSDGSEAVTAPARPVYEPKMTRVDLVTSLYIFCSRYTDSDYYCNYGSRSTKSYGEYSDSIIYGEKPTEHKAGERNDENMPVTNSMYIDCAREEDMLAAMEWGCDTGLLKGYPDGTIKPERTVTRAEYATLMDRFIDFMTSCSKVSMTVKMNCGKFEIENAEGGKLTCDKGVPEGSIEVLSSSRTVGASVDLMLELPYSDSFRMSTENGKLDMAVSHIGNYTRIEGENIDCAEFSDTVTTVSGNDISVTITVFSSSKILKLSGIRSDGFSCVREGDKFIFDGVDSAEKLEISEAVYGDIEKTVNDISSRITDGRLVLEEKDRTVIY